MMAPIFLVDGPAEGHTKMVNNPRAGRPAYIPWYTEDDKSEYVYLYYKINDNQDRGTFIKQIPFKEIVKIAND